MKQENYLCSEGLGLMPEAERLRHLKAVLKGRLDMWKKLGLSHREAMKLATKGYADKGLPDYKHRSFVSDTYPAELLEPKPFAFTNNLSDDEAQKVIDNYLERYPKFKMWGTDYE